MATFTQANQNLQFEIPDQGVFKIPGDASGGILVRKGNQVYSTNLQDIGFQALLSQGKANMVNGQINAPGYGGRDAQQFGKEYLSSLGYNFDALQSYGGNVADIQTAFGGAPKNAFQSGLSLTDIFTTPTAKGEDLIKSVSQTNPNAAITTASSGQIISGGNAPTFSQAGAINPGNLASYRNPNVDLQKVTTITPSAITGGSSTPSLPTPPSNTVGAGVVTGGTMGTPQPNPLATQNAQGATTGGSSSLESLLQQYLGSSTPPPSTADAYQSALGSSGVLQKQQQVNDLTAQLNQAMAEANIANLTLEQQSSGKDVTSDFLGRQQQEISRQSAIRILPIQAQLAAAQGNLETAQNTLNTVFQLKSQDAQAQYQYQKELRDAVFNFATEQQKALLSAKQKEDDRNFTLSVNNLNNAQSLSKLATENGQYDVAAAITKLNPQSSTFTQDLANLQSQIRPKSVVGTGKYTSAQDKQIDQINTSVSNNFSYKAVNSAKSFADGVITSLGQQNGLSDIAAINQFQKVIDEGAVTRDQDVKLVQGAQSLVNSLKLKIKKLEGGDQLSPQQREQMRESVQALYNAKVNALQDDPYIKSQITKAQQNGIDANDTILGFLGTFSSSSTGGNQTTPTTVSNEDAYAEYLKAIGGTNTQTTTTNNPYSGQPAFGSFSGFNFFK